MAFHDQALFVHCTRLISVTLTYDPPKYWVSPPLGEPVRAVRRPDLRASSQLENPLGNLSSRSLGPGFRALGWHASPVERPSSLRYLAPGMGSLPSTNESTNNRPGPVTMMSEAPMSYAPVNLLVLATATNVSSRCGARMMRDECPNARP